MAGGGELLQFALGIRVEANVILIVSQSRVYLGCHQWLLVLVPAPQRDRLSVAVLFTADCRDVLSVGRNVDGLSAQGVGVEDRLFWNSCFSIPDYQHCIWAALSVYLFNYINKLFS